MSLPDARRDWCPLAFVACTAVLAVGCSSDRLPTYPVTGRVVFQDGSTVRAGSIELKSREYGVQARGEIGDDGTFRLTTYRDDDGAVEGVHDCVVVQLVMVEELDDFKPSTEGIVDSRFGSYSTSGLECQVSPGEDNFVTLTVDAMHPKPVSDDSTASPDHDHSHHRHHYAEADAK